jgi:hypothetical protein
VSNLRTKHLALSIKAATLEAAQLAAISAYTLEEMPAERLYARKFVMAHNAIDRDKECFSEQVLADFARTLPGKGLYIKHPTSWEGDGGPAEGRFYAAELVRMSHAEARTMLREPSLTWPPDALDAVVLIGHAYTVRTADNESLLAKVDGGVAGDISIGFNAKSPERIRDAAGIELNVWRWNSPAEALEGSLVWLGAQPGARAVKSATKEHDMELEEQLRAEQAKTAAQETRIKALEGDGNLVAAIRKAFGDNAALVIDTPAVAADLITAGKSFRDGLVDDIVAAERQLGVLGDDAAAVEAAKATHAALSVDRLQALAKHYAARVPTGSKVTGGDPTKQNQGAGKLPDALNSPLI